MKKLLWSLLLAAGTGLLFTACNNEEEDIPTEDVTVEEDLAISENLLLELDDQVDDYLEAAGLEEGRADFRGNDCAEITLDQPRGMFPNTITIDFGPDGCEGPNGRLWKGKIIVYLTDTLKNPGASRTVTLEGVTVDDVSIEGTKVFTNMGANSEGDYCLSRKKEVKITFPGGGYVEWSARQEACLIEGRGTPTVWDNVWSITGESSGMNSRGGTFSSKVLEPLIKKRACPWLVSGIREVTVNDRTRTINYGDGQCDRFAQVTLANGRTIIIRLR